MLIPWQVALIPPQPRRSAGTHSQEGQSLSPSENASGTTAGDATSSADNAAGATQEQGLRPKRQMPQLP